MDNYPFIMNPHYLFDAIAGNKNELCRNTVPFKQQFTTTTKFSGNSLWLGSTDGADILSLVNLQGNK